jgi:hypothetical protein
MILKVRFLVDYNSVLCFLSIGFTAIFLLVVGRCVMEKFQTPTQEYLYDTGTVIEGVITEGACVSVTRSSSFPFLSTFNR